MLLVNDAALLLCPHQGKVQIIAGQGWVSIAGSKVMVSPQPDGRPFDSGCMWKGGGMVPCTVVANVTAGYSSFMRVDGRPVCLEGITGHTGGNSGGLYTVRNAGQTFVRSNA
jgi:hypothetical protein